MKKLFVPILLCLIVGPSLPEFRTVRGNNPQFVYNGFSGSNLTLDGSPRITSTGLMELTNDTSRIKGHAFYPSPLRFRRSPNGTVQSFSLSFVFGLLSSFSDIRGHGFAFFISPSTDFTDAFPIQFMGLLNSTNNGNLSNHVFAVELDTVQNTEFGDIDNNHVGIDTNSLNSLKSSTAGFHNDKNGRFTNLQLRGSGPIQTWVEYDGNTTQIDVTIAPFGMEKPDCMVNGSLDKYLYGKEGRSALDWGQRIKIIKGIAAGLLYLHEEWDKVIIHRDVKPNNVLNKEMKAKLGDFSLARLYDHGTDLQTIHVVGTIGYLAPELVHRGKATTLTDVFAFGVFILEVTCGKKAVTEDTQGHQHMLVDWVIQNWHKDSLLDAVDIKLQGDYDTAEVCLALKLGLLCSHPYPDARPNMRQVLQYLDGDVPLPELLPAHFSFHMLTLMQEGQLDSSTMSSLYPSPRMMDFGSISISLDGR
ncbi:hypothetical protein QOZ80_3BG0273190 [Eleusine coracana subsp. coracana]|nr:hypothetical protein QOZ80_3BG0273190 [Eleusine coracana subsp. coracana]